MKPSTMLVWAGAVAVIGGLAGTVLLSGKGHKPGIEAEPSRCLSGATVDISASPSKIALGQTSTVRWQVGLPNGCGNVHVRLSGVVVGANGSRVVTPSRTSTFVVTVSQAHSAVGGRKSRSTTVEVTYPDRILIDPNTRDPVRVLLGALADSSNERQVVELCNVDLDLTGVTGIVIGSNRSLIASPACARGPRSFGPRIFVTDKRSNAPLFVIRGDNVLVSGFRLEGPTTDIAQGDAKEKGIVIWPPAGTQPLRNVEISNMEIFHWSGLGIQVVDNVEMAERGRLFNTNPNAVRISGTYFHHNRHGAGYGYGVVVSAGAYALIERNVFDENRHAIAGGSRNLDALDYSGYTARDNLILPGGGKHCSETWIWALTGWRLNCWQTHQIDMHGDSNEWYSDSNWLCGTAGETMLIERNTILYTSGLAIKIRGNPADKVVVDGNVFKHGSRSSAVGQTGGCGWGDNITRPVDVRPNNAFGVDPTTPLGSCDFFGDGQQDQFMATGVTWWAKSPVTQQWRYLNTMPETLPQLQLARFDNDAVCDVALRPRRPEVPPDRYSRSGTGPWVGQTVMQ